MADGARNEGFRMLDEFVCEPPRSRGDPLASALRYGRNEGMHLCEEFVLDMGAGKPTAGALNGSATGPLDTLRLLAEQHQQMIQNLVDRLKVTIDDLKKQNEDLKARIREPDPVAKRYHLDGPNEDEI